MKINLSTSRSPSTMNETHVRDAGRRGYWSLLAGRKHKCPQQIGYNRLRMSKKETAPPSSLINHFPFSLAISFTFLLLCQFQLLSFHHYMHQQLLNQLHVPPLSLPCLAAASTRSSAASSTIASHLSISRLSSSRLLVCVNAFVLRWPTRPTPAINLNQCTSPNPPHYAPRLEGPRVGVHLRVDRL